MTPITKEDITSKEPKSHAFEVEDKIGEVKLTNAYKKIYKCAERIIFELRGVIHNLKEEQVEEAEVKGSLTN